MDCHPFATLFQGNPDRSLPSAWHHDRSWHHYHRQSTSLPLTTRQVSWGCTRFPIMAAMPTPETAQSPPWRLPSPLPATSELVEDDLLVEEISIDGMCGVY